MMYLGRRFIAKRKPIRWNEPALNRYRIEVWHHDLHPTKGWQLAKHYTVCVSKREYESTKPTVIYWRPAKRHIRSSPTPEIHIKPGREYVHAWQRKLRDAAARTMEAVLAPTFPGIKVVPHGVV